VQPRLALLVALGFLPYLIPGLARFRAPVPQAFKLSVGEAASAVEQRAHEAGSAQSESSRPIIPGEIEDSSGRALNHFFAALLGSESEGAQTRICHYGDSPITNDGITSTMRRRFQTRFGDAGHGFVLIAKPWGWYGHSGITTDASSGWLANPMFISRGDHLYGLGGASFTATEAGVSASFSTATEGEVGRAVSSFDIYFLSQPGGGDFEVEVDDGPVETVVTASEKIESQFYRVNVEKSPHTLRLKAAGNGEVRLFGVTMDSGADGVQYDSLGVNGAFIGLLANYLDPDHWAEQLGHRRPNLVVIGYGANESQFERLPMDQYERDTKEAIRRIRAALPEVSIMFLGPMDRGQRGAGGSIVTRPMILKLIAYQRRIAAETGCAFFDTFTAMGGSGTAARWLEARPRLMGGDYTHPTAQGSEIVGTLIYDAMIRAFEKYKTGERN
jgi:lysophospholipase L1-like esterase